MPSPSTASQSRINAERLAHLLPKGNPPDSIRPEHALATVSQQTSAGSNARREFEQPDFLKAASLSRLVAAWNSEMNSDTTECRLKHRNNLPVHRTDCRTHDNLFARIANSIFVAR